MTGKLLRCKLYIIIFITRLLFLFRFPVHHSAAMKNFYSENRNHLSLLDWPRCFNDIMPVEWLWKVMIDKLNENQIKVFSELWEEIFKVWQKVCTKDFVFSLLNNITVNLERVVKNQGDYYVN